MLWNYAGKNFLLNTFALSQVSDSELQPINHFSEARVVLHGTWRQNIESIRKTVIFFKLRFCRLWIISIAVTYAICSYIWQTHVNCCVYHLRKGGHFAIQTPHWFETPLVRHSNSPTPINSPTPVQVVTLLILKNCMVDVSFLKLVSTPFLSTKN